MKMTMQTAINVFTALGQLDGLQQAVRNGATSAVINVPYDFKGSLRRIIYRNHAILRAEIDAFNLASQAEWRRIVGDRARLDETVAADAALKAEYDQKMRELQNEEVEIGLKYIQEDALNLDKNPIPGSVLSMLEPIIEFPDEKEQADAAVRSTG